MSYSPRLNYRVSSALLGVWLLATAQSIPVAAQNAAPTGDTYDVVVYGGTSSGIVAAVQVRRMGKTVQLVEPGEHLGGLTAGGLGATDIGNKGAIGGIAREYYRRLGDHYALPAAWKFEKSEAYQGGRRGKAGTAAEPEAWTFEPSVAEQVYRDMLKQDHVPVVFRERLDLKQGVQKKGPRITSIKMESGKTFSARMFIDATYEGDLMAKAGVKYTVGREANSQYKETLNGVQLGSKTHQFKVPVDPYVKPGDPSSGLLPGIQGTDPGQHGEGDRRVQAYNFRMCLTDVADNKLPFPKPAGYDPLRYELLLRYINAGVWDAFGPKGSIIMMPNRKTDVNNNGGFSTDNIGMNYDYPDGDYATRDKIIQEHIQYQQGMMWFLANDPRVPEQVRKDTNRWGLCKDEFLSTSGWPHQMYVREARRMVSAYVMTQDNCQGRITAEDAVGMAAYGMDSHNTQRYAKDGRVYNEGDVQVHGFTPYPVAYRSLVPKQDECDNLLVPVCLSATHIAYGSIRMEPVFMVLGQSSATAAVQAIDAKVAIQQIDYSQLKARLVADKQILAWTGPKAVARAGIDIKTLKGVVADDDQAEFKGDWTPSNSTSGFVGAGYMHDGNADKGTKSATFTLKLPKAGRYQVRIAYTPYENRATNVPVTIHAADGEKQVKLNEREKPETDGLRTVGTYSFDTTAKIVIGTAGTDGHVVVDAVQVKPE